MKTKSKGSRRTGCHGKEWQEGYYIHGNLRLERYGGASIE